MYYQNKIEAKLIIMSKQSDTKIDCQKKVVNGWYDKLL